MSKESIVCELNADSDWDGVTLINLNRDAAIATNQRYFKFAISGPHGQIGADIGGLFSATSPKLVGIAGSSWNPEAKARVISSDPSGSFRQEITLKPAIQYVLLYPNDKLALLTKDGRPQIVLVVNELNESEMVSWGLEHRPYCMPTRFRIIREAGAAFVPNFANVWQPIFTHDSNTGLLIANDNGTGAIPASNLCLYPRWQGCYISIRYSGHNNNGKLHIVDNPTKRNWAAESGMTDVKWSKVQFVSHDDHIALEATPAVVGQIMVCDIEVALVHPGNRLAGRYQGSA